MHSAASYHLEGFSFARISLRLKPGARRQERGPETSRTPHAAALHAFAAPPHEKRSLPFLLQRKSR